MAQQNKIGIKLYNDTFVPILNSNEKKAKKLLLTTVRDNQEKTIIELYEGTSNKCVNNNYLGKLLIPISRQTKKGEPSIEVHISLDEKGLLHAKAWDAESSAENEIQIEYSGLAGEKIIQTTLVGEPAGKVTKADKNNYPKTKGEQNKDMRSVIRLALIILGIILALGLLSTLTYYGITKLGPAIVKQLKSGKKTVKKEKIDKAKSQSSSSAAKEEKIIGKKDLKGSKHYIKWGDNLWNICKKYYQYPWYYPALAEANSIKHPRLIFAGTYLIIPPKSDLKRWEFPVEENI